MSMPVDLRIARSTHGDPDELEADQAAFRNAARVTESLLHGRRSPTNIAAWAIAAI